jgi:hypothetical protein
MARASGILAAFLLSGAQPFSNSLSITDRDHWVFSSTIWGFDCGSLPTDALLQPKYAIPFVGGVVRL